MSDKQSEFKDNPTTYHAQMRHQSKYRLELDVADSPRPVTNKKFCLLYTSDAADD